MRDAGNRGGHFIKRIAAARNVTLA